MYAPAVTEPVGPTASGYDAHAPLTTLQIASVAARTHVGRSACNYEGTLATATGNYFCGHKRWNSRHCTGGAVHDPALEVHDEKSKGLARERRRGGQRLLGGIDLFEIKGITCQMRTSDGGRESSVRRMMVTMRVTGPTATPPWPIGMDITTCGGWGTADGCSEESGRLDMGTLLRGCNDPPVLHSTCTSCRDSAVRSNSVQLLPLSESTALDMTGANKRSL